jgi:hypothetical protein
VSKLPPRIKPGDRVFVKGWPPQSLKVIDCDHPSIITLKSEHGATLKVGRKALILVSETAEVSC